MMPVRRTFDHDQILALYRGGMSMENVARHVGCSTSLAHRVIQDAGESRPATTQRRHIDNAARTAAAEGWQLVRCIHCGERIEACEGRWGDWMHVPAGRRNGPERCAGGGSFAEPPTLDPRLRHPSMQGRAS